MASAAASKIENGKQARSITIGEKVLHASIDLVVKHIVALKDFLINRPRVKKILFRSLRHGFALLICPFKNLRFGRLCNHSSATRRLAPTRGLHWLRPAARGSADSTAQRPLPVTRPH